jgi:outer membrane protein assembly factor BamB
VERHRAAERAQAPPIVAAETSPANVETGPQARLDTAGASTPNAPTPTKEQGLQTRLPAPYWTDFRGPKRDGEYSEGPVLLNWPATGLKPIWKQPAGAGYASFVIARGRAFTIEQRGSQEVVAAYDVPTGREIWTNAWAAEFRESMGGDGPRATPTFHEGRLYSQGALGELRCLDAATGKRIWSRNILTDNQADNLQWGMSNSPLIVDDKVIVMPGGPSG